MNDILNRVIAFIEALSWHLHGGAEKNLSQAVFNSAI
jgi:hypothetical protein